MILDSLVLTNLLLLGVASVAGLYGGFQALRVVRHWNPESSSSRQLALEKKTYLVTSVVRLVLFAEIVGAALFIFTASGLAEKLQGAMCAYGALNSNDYGFAALGVKSVGLFAFGYWLSLDSLDRSVRGHPFVVTKYRAFLLMLPLVLLDLGVTAAYFVGIDPQVVTSCCSTSFSAAAGFDSSFRGVLEPLYVFAAFLGLVAATQVLRLRGTGRGAYAFSAAALGAFFAGAASLTVFVAPHVYEVIHFCPFDLLLPEHGYVGYPMYLALFAGGVYGVVPAALQPFHGAAGEELYEIQSRAALRSSAALLLLAAASVFYVASYFLERGVLIV